MTDAGPAAVTEATLENAHLKPMWERLRIGRAGGVAFVGIPIGNKVNDDSVENHSRHLHSLLRLLDLPFTKNYLDVALVEVDGSTLELPPPPPETPEP